MKLRWLILAAVCLLPEVARADSRVCAACHSAIYEKYQKTAMARSFYRASEVTPVEDFYHAASDTHFAVLLRDGQYYQRRLQTGFDGKETNVEEKSIDYVMGSGNHVRTYLHKTSSGVLQELPLAWYAEKGGYWAMNPGYDNPDQPNSRRKINYECMGCHNAYPQIPSGHAQLQAEPLYSGTLPEGIDCQRCHGSGDQHVRAAQTPGAKIEAIRAAVVNPSKLSADRQLEVCMQCHLETTSFPFPHSISRFDRAPFSFEAGQSLAEHTAYFDHAPATPGDDDRFQIVNSVYRLRMSACFLKSGGKLQCTTCHDPHGAEVKPVNQVCRECHNSEFQVTVAAGKHTAEANCTDCHMPKRRTDDVVHAVMTDHLIQRWKPGRDLLAEKPELNGPAVVYKGEVLPYYPAKPGELALALAQVSFDVNALSGIKRLTEAIRTQQPRQAEYYVELAAAILRNGKATDALPVYREALEVRPDSLAGLLGLGRTLEAIGGTADAAGAYERATQFIPENPLAWQMLGETRMRLRRVDEAKNAFAKSLEFDSEVPETHYALGVFWTERGDPIRAEASFREAIRLQPDYSQAHLNLAVILSNFKRFDEAGFHYERALRYRPDYKLAHLNYGLMLLRAGRTAEGEQHIKAGSP